MLFSNSRACVEKAARSGSAYRSLERMAAAYRAFAKKNPRAYKLIFEDIPPFLDGRSDRDARLAAAAPLLRVLADEVGEERALLGARTLVPFLHGFLLMELNGLFRFGGNINEAFRFGVSTTLNALLGSGGRTRRRVLEHSTRSEYGRESKRTSLR